MRFRQSLQVVGSPVDVCVCGATPSGILAAIAVKRENRSVVVVEPVGVRSAWCAA
ncbi:FAD-dependent oxidoreductase [Stieleria neptunia]|uniref:FAD-dependent oxidoreductase n=1 Tax=Stieleria neptunia TaxID=2527979 RepID=UPI00119E98C3